MANAHLTFDPVTKHIVRNHANVTFYGNTRAKNLRLGRWHFLSDIYNDRACTSQTVETSATGLYAYGSTLNFASSRMQTAINAALGANFAATNFMAGLDFSFWQYWDAWEWDGSSWIVPPFFYWYDYATATCCRFKYAVPIALQTGDVQKVFIEIPSMGLTTGQWVDYVTDGGNYSVIDNYTAERVNYLSNTTMGFDVYLSSTAPGTPGTSYDLRIPINTGTNKMVASGVPILFDPNQDYSVWTNPNDTSGVYIQLDIAADRVKALFSGSHVYVVLKPYFSSYPFMGTIKPYPTGRMNPNTPSVVSFCNNRTIYFGQSMTAGYFGGPQLGVYSK
jgi:hypothetical protein